MREKKSQVDFDTYQKIMLAAMFDDTLEEAEVQDTPRNRELLKEALILIDEAEKNGMIVDFPS